MTTLKNACIILLILALMLGLLFFALSKVKKSKFQGAIIFREEERL